MLCSFHTNLVVTSGIISFLLDILFRIVSCTLQPHRIYITTYLNLPCIPTSDLVCLSCIYWLGYSQPIGWFFHREEIQFSLIIFFTFLKPYNQPLKFNKTMQTILVRNNEGLFIQILININSNLCCNYFFC